MDLILNSSIVENNTGIADILIDSINKKWDNVRDFNSIIVNLKEENYDEMVPVIESILEDENKNIGRLQQLVELITPNSESIDDGKQEAIDILDGNDTVFEGNEMKLSENFTNVVDKTTTVISPVLAKSIEEHDEDKKKYDDAMKENQKLADETVPKEGETGKKITSPELKKMKLSEELFDVNTLNDTIDELASYGNDADTIQGYIEAVSDSDESLEKLEIELESSLDDYIYNRIDNCNESLKLKIAREQLQRFNESKMPESWTPEKYISKLVEKKHLTEDEGKALLTESVVDINNFRKVLARILYNLKEAHDDLDPKADRFDIASTIVNGSLHELQQLDKALQNYRDGE